MTCSMSRLSAVSWIKQPNTNGGLSFDTVRLFAASGAGSSTTIVSTGLAAHGDSDDDFVGWIVECVSATNTQNQNLRRRILANDDSESTLTTDPWPAATASGDQFLLMKPPHALAVARSAASITASAIPCRDLSQTNDYWNGLAQVGGPYAEVVNAAAASLTNHPRVADFVGSTQRVILASALSGAVAIGDYFELWNHPEIVNDGLIELTQEPIERMAMTGSYGKPAARPGLRAGSGAQELAFRGPGTGRAGLHAEAHELLSLVMNHTDSGGGSTTNGSPSTTNIPYSSGNHTVGSLALTAEGYACMVTADSGSAYTVSPATGVATAASATLYGMTTYRPTGGCKNGAMSIKQWRGKGILEYLWGCVPDLTFTAAKGDFLKISAAWQVADWIRLGASGTELSRPFTPKRPSVDQLKVGVGRAVLDSVALKVKSFTFGTGLDIQPRTNTSAPNSTDGFETVGDDPNGTIEVYWDASERKAMDDFLAGKEIEMIYQCGAAPGFPGVFVFYAYRIRYMGAGLSDDAGNISVSLPFKVIEDPNAASGIPRYAIGIC